MAYSMELFHGMKPLFHINNPKICFVVTVDFLVTGAGRLFVTSSPSSPFPSMIVCLNLRKNSLCFFMTIKSEKKKKKKKEIKRLIDQI